MKRTVAVLGTFLGLLLMVVPPASAQMAVGGSVEVEGVPPPPQYVLTADGTLIMGGDIIFNCNEFAQFVERHGDPGDPPPSYPFGRIDPEEARSWAENELEQARGVLEECERVGFSPSGGTGAGSGVPNGVADAEGTPVGGVTEDGFVRTQYDTFVACGSGFPVVEQYAEACGEAGLPPAGSVNPSPNDDGDAVLLPETGGSSLVPPLAALLVASGVLAGVVRRRTP